MGKLNDLLTKIIDLTVLNSEMIQKTINLFPKISVPDINSWGQELNKHLEIKDKK